MNLNLSSDWLLVCFGRVIKEANAIRAGKPGIRSALKRNETYQTYLEARFPFALKHQSHIDLCETVEDNTRNQFL